MCKIGCVCVKLSIKAWGWGKKVCIHHNENMRGLVGLGKSKSKLVMSSKHGKHQNCQARQEGENAHFLMCERRVMATNI